MGTSVPLLLIKDFNMATTDVSICSAGLLMAGDEEISALPGNTRRGKVCANIYENTKLMLLSQHPWRFAIGQASLSRLVAEPLFDKFKYAYQLPSDYSRLIQTERNTDFQIYEDKIYSNQETLNIEYEFSPDEGQFPVYFTRALELKMAQILSIAIAEDKSKAVLFEEEHIKQMRHAKSIDNQSKRASFINANALTRVRT